MIQKSKVKLVSITEKKSSLPNTLISNKVLQPLANFTKMTESHVFLMSPKATGDILEFLWAKTNKRDQSCVTYCLACRPVLGPEPING